MRRPDEQRLDADALDGVRVCSHRLRMLCSVFVKMNMDVRHVVVTVLVDVYVRASTQSAKDGARAQAYNHQGHAELQPVRHRRRNADTQRQHDCADDDECRRMTHTPQTADERRAQDIALLADDGRDGNDVVYLSRVLETEKEAEAENRKRAQRSQGLISLT